MLKEAYQGSHGVIRGPVRMLTTADDDEMIDTPFQSQQLIDESHESG